MFINRKTIPTQMLVNKVCKTKGYSRLGYEIKEDCFMVKAIVGKTTLTEVKIPFAEIVEMFEWKDIHVGKEITDIEFKEEKEEE